MIGRSALTSSKLDCPSAPARRTSTFMSFSSGSQFDTGSLSLSSPSSTIDIVATEVIGFVIEASMKTASAVMGFVFAASRKPCAS